MSYYSQIYIYIQNASYYTFYYSYNDNSTFNDLLESFAFNFPTLNICPCFKIQYNDNYNGFLDLDMGQKVSPFLNNNYTQYNLIYKKNFCLCNSILKNNYKKAKIQIINDLNKNIEMVNSLQKEIKNKDATISNLSISQSKLSKENSNLNVNKENLNKRLNEKINSLEIENKKLNKEINEFELENNNMNNNLNRYKSDLKDLKKERSKLIMENKEKENLIKKLNEKINSLKQENKYLNKEINEFKLENNDMNNNLNTYRSNLKDLKNKKSDLIMENMEKENLNKKLNEKINSLEIENKKLKKEINEFKFENNNMNNNLNTYRTNLKDLKIEKSDLIMENKEKENLNKKLNEKINSLEIENKNLNKEISNFKLEKNDMNNNLNRYKSDLNNLKNEKSNLIMEKENLNKVLNEKINSLEIENKDLNNKNNEFQLEIEEQLKQKKINEQKMNDLTVQNEKFIQEKKGNEKTNKDINFIEFYDVIINIDSIKNIIKGWEIKMSENGKNNYEKFKKEKVLKIGVVGNANKGKSFLLSKISKIDLPSGASIRTEGLSIKYPDLEIFKDRKIVLLDTAGLETPVLKEEVETPKEDKKENEEEKNEKEIFREKSREKIITEYFLQNYIINNSDILIIVVGNLTYSEQKLLNRITKDFIKVNNNEKVERSLYIIHNLITYKTKTQVEEYINDFLLKSATFELEEGHNISTEKKEEEKIIYYYYEKNTKHKIFHLIFAHEGSEAGDIYNNLTLKYLENTFQNITNLQSYDVIESVKKSFIRVSREILEKFEPPIDENSFDNSNNNLIKLTNANNIILKKSFIDELGFTNLKTNGYEPTYNVYKQDNKIILKVEIPGNSKIEADFEQSSPYDLIKVKGKKWKDKFPKKLEDNIHNYREYGDFSLEIPLNAGEYKIKNKSPEITPKNGILIVEFELEEKMNSGKFEIKEEDQM